MRDDPADRRPPRHARPRRVAGAGEVGIGGLGAGGRRRWVALVFIALAQLLIAIDVTVVNVALPSVQIALDMSDESRQWVVAGYTLAFGGLLLAGGRVADRIGHKRAFLAGLLLFTAASALGGAAGNATVLIGARVLQGVFGTLLSPSALALVTTTFADQRDRVKAFGVYSAVASGGMAAGFVIGGLVTQYAGWRWAFYLSVPFGLVAAVGGALILPSSPPRRSGRLDLPGMALSAGMMVALVLAAAEARGRGASAALPAAAAALLLLGALVWVERRASSPLIPPLLLRDRTRIGVYLVVTLAMMGLFGLFLLATYYLQTIRGFSPMVTGLAFLPLVVAMAVGSTQVAARLPNVAPAGLICAGFGLALGAVLLLTRVTLESGYATLLLPAMILLGVGLGMVFVPCTNLATGRVPPQISGVASAMYGTVQQFAAAVGTVLMNGAAAAAAARFAREHPGITSADPEAVVRGFTASLWWAAALLAAGLIVAATMVRPYPPADDAAPETDAEPGRQDRRARPPGRHLGPSSPLTHQAPPSGAGRVRYFN